MSSNSWLQQTISGRHMNIVFILKWQQLVMNNVWDWMTVMADSHLSWWMFCIYRLLWWAVHWVSGSSVDSLLTLIHHVPYHVAVIETISTTQKCKTSSTQLSCTSSGAIQNDNSFYVIKLNKKKHRTHQRCWFSIVICEKGCKSVLLIKVGCNTF